MGACLSDAILLDRRKSRTESGRRRVFGLRVAILRLEAVAFELAPVGSRLNRSKIF